MTTISQEELETKVELLEENTFFEGVLPKEVEALNSSSEAFVTVDSINQLITFINRHIVDRQEIVRQTFYALLTGEHQLLLSRTGMAKSLLARQIFSCCEGATIFEKQLTKDTMPDNLFGAYDIDQLKKGKMIHNVEGSIVTADFAFLDEIFDANDMLLRSLLSLLNEKRLVNGQQQIKSSLNSVIGATNYVRATEMLEAVLDRFLYKSYILENKDLYLLLNIDFIYQKNHGLAQEPPQKIHLKKFLNLKKIIKSSIIEIPDYILFLKNYILREYIEYRRKTDPRYTISDRTSVKIQDLLRASAILDYRLKVEEKDLYQIFYIICMIGQTEEKDQFTAIIDTARKYFGSDKEMLEDAFQLIRVILKLKNTQEGAKVNYSELLSIVEHIEKVIKEKKGIFRQKLQYVTDRIHSYNKIEIVKLIDIIHQYCTLLRQTAAKKETLEIIGGLEKEIEDLHPQAFVE